MHIKIVHAHESKDSFSSALAQTAEKFFMNKDHSVSLTDLYKIGFNPVGGKHDFKSLSDAKYYKYAVEQINAHSRNSFADDLRNEMEDLAKADVLILNFPLWWFGMPAILKGWVDRVFAYGFAYGGDYGLYKDGRFKGKKAFLSITTGSPASFYKAEGTHGRSLENILRNLNEGVIGLVGYEVLSPFIGYSVSRISDTERKNILAKYMIFLEQNFTK